LKIKNFFKFLYPVPLPLCETLQGRGTKGEGLFPLFPQRGGTAQDLEFCKNSREINKEIFPVVIFFLTTRSDLKI
jgi:hypothetical protein